MAIQKWQAGPSGTLGNTTGAEMAEGFNGLVGRASIYLEDFGVTDTTTNAAPMIVSALAALRTGQVLTTKLEQVNITEKISYKFSAAQEYASIYLPCRFVLNSANTEGAIYLDGAGFTFGSIEIGAVGFLDFNFHDSVGAQVSTGVGVEVRNFWQTDIDIYQTMNFMTGTRAVGGDLATSGNGFALSYLRVRKAFSPKIVGARSLEVTTIPFSGVRGYFNSNRIACNFLRGYDGIVFVKGSLQTDPFNGNTVIDTSFENLVDRGCVLEYAAGNTLVRPRFEGGNVPNKWVEETTDCIANVVIVAGTPDSEKIELNGSGSRIEGWARTGSGAARYTQTLVGSDSTDVTGNNNTIYMANRYVAGVTPNNTFFWGGISGQDRWSKFAGGVVDMNGGVKIFGLLNPLGSIRESGNSGDQQVPVGMSVISLALNGATDLSLTMNEDREINGFEMRLEIRSAINGIEIKKSTGTVNVAIGEITTTGVYSLVYLSDVWRWSRIGDTYQ